MTRRCLEEDLRLDVELVRRDAKEFCAEHEVLRKLDVLRGADPSGGEQISGLPTGYKSLHYGRGRGATQWVEHLDVCWLVACGENHTSGDRKDVYNDFLRLHGRGELAPTADDYEALEDEDVTATFLEQLRSLGSDLLEEARLRPGSEAVDSLHRGSGNASVVVDVFVLPGEGSVDECWIGITPPSNVSWPATDVFEIALALTGYVELSHADVVGRRPRRAGEIAFTWDAYHEGE